MIVGELQLLLNACLLALFGLQFFFDSDTVRPSLWSVLRVVASLLLFSTSYVTQDPTVAVATDGLAFAALFAGLLKYTRYTSGQRSIFSVLLVCFCATAVVESYHADSEVAGYVSLAVCVSTVVLAASVVSDWQQPESFPFVALFFSVLGIASLCQIANVSSASMEWVFLARRVLIGALAVFIEARRAEACNEFP